MTQRIGAIDQTDQVLVQSRRCADIFRGRLQGPFKGVVRSCVAICFFVMQECNTIYAGSAVDSDPLNTQMLTLIRVSYIIILYTSRVRSAIMLCMHDMLTPLHDHCVMY